MKSIVIYYSRSGNTQTVAEEIATHLGSDLRPLIDKKKRSGAWGWLWAGWDALMQNKTKLEDFGLDINEYELIFIGCPNWATNLPPATRTFLLSHSWQDKKVVLFCTQDSMGAERVLNNLRRLCVGADIVSEKFFNRVNLNKDVIKEQVREWMAQFKA